MPSAVHPTKLLISGLSVHVAAIGWEKARSSRTLREFLRVCVCKSSTTNDPSSLTRRKVKPISSDERSNDATQLSGLVLFDNVP